MKKTLTLIFLSVLSLAVFGQGQKKDYSNGVSIHKGMWFSSLSLSASTKSSEFDRQLFTNFLEQEKNALAIRVDPGYIIKDNLGIGVGFLYGNLRDISTQQASDGTLSEVKLAEREFAFRPYIKNFIPLGKDNRFYIVVPTEIQIGYGSQLKETTTNQQLNRDYSTGVFYGLEMRPGMLVFVQKNFGFEVNVGAFGLSNSIIKKESTNMPDSKVVTNDLSLKINLFELSLGFSVYL
jgi:hypothetical protein